MNILYCDNATCVKSLLACLSDIAGGMISLYEPIRFSRLWREVMRVMRENAKNVILIMSGGSKQRFASDGHCSKRCCLMGASEGKLISNYQMMYPNQLERIENCHIFLFFVGRVCSCLSAGTIFHFVFAFTNMVQEYEPHEGILGVMRISL